MKTVIFLILSFIVTFPVYSQFNPPVALNDTTEVVSQHPVIIDVLANDYDPDGGPVFIKSWNSPRHGDADTVGEKILYKSNAYSGMDSLKYRIKDGQNLLSQYAWILIDVLVNPDVPVAVTDTFNLLELEEIDLPILDNDYDPNGDEIKIHHISGDTYCSVSVSEDSSYVTVKPDLDKTWGYFWYAVMEKNSLGQYISGSVMAWFTISDNPDIPVPLSDLAEATGGIPVQVPVLSNDYDNQGDSFEIKDFTQPTNGLVTKEGNNLVYLPAVCFKGTDRFDYCIREVVDTGIYSAYVTVTVEVSKNPDCPVGVPDSASGMKASPMTIEVLPNDIDINGDPVELWDVSSANNATVSISDDMIDYTSWSLAHDEDTIYYRTRQLNDPLYYSEWTPVFISLSVNPDLPVAVTDYVETRSGLPIIVRPLDNDFSLPGDTMVLLAAAPHYGRIEEKFDSSFRYLPFYNTTGLDSIHYVIWKKFNLSLMAEGEIIVNVIDQHFYDSLEINNINAGINANGFLFSRIWEMPGQGNIGGVDPHFRFPAGGMKNTIFTSSLWMGGLDQDDSLHLCAERYKSLGIDYQSGPVSDTYNTEHYIKYGRTWKISATEVEFHRNNFWTEGYQPVEAIGSWPGNGDPASGEASQLAPYGDLNNDGIYNPLDGDYPLIRGDQCVFFMSNDDLDHTESQGERIKLEVHAMVYGFDEPADSALNNTIFVHYDLINRSELTYHNAFAGIFTDLDLGNPYDDYIASDVSRGSYFIYNGDEFDEDYFNQNDYSWTHGYGDKPAVQSVTLLAGPFMEADGSDNPSGSCDESVNGLNFGNGVIDDERIGLSRFIYFNNSSGGYATDPVLPDDYYSFMKGIWKDESPMLYGGNGHLTTGAVGPECNFMFPGASDPLNWGTNCNFPNGGYNQDGKYWTEADAGNTPDDRRGVGITGPFTFDPGDVQEIDVAFCAANGWEGTLSSIGRLMENIDSIKYAVAHGEIISLNNELGINDEDMEESRLKISPNPSNSVIHISLPANSHGQADYEIYNIPGTLCLKRVIDSGKEMTIDIALLKPGFYLIILNTKGNVFTGHFIKF